MISMLCEICFKYFSALAREEMKQFPECWNDKNQYWKLKKNLSRISPIFDLWFE